MYIQVGDMESYSTIIVPNVLVLALIPFYKIILSDQAI